MYLYEFVQQLHDQIDDFEDWYNTKMTEDPDQFPIEMDKDLWVMAYLEYEK